MIELVKESQFLWQKKEIVQRVPQVYSHFKISQKFNKLSNWSVVCTITLVKWWEFLWQKIVQRKFVLFSSSATKTL